MKIEIINKAIREGLSLEIAKENLNLEEQEERKTADYQNILKGFDIEVL